MNRSSMGKQINNPGMKKPKGYAPGGSIPKNMKGFSKLPEGVQQKMNSAMAEKYSGGGLIKGKIKARGIGAATQGYSFKA